MNSTLGCFAGFCLKTIFRLELYASVVYLCQICEKTNLSFFGTWPVVDLVRHYNFDLFDHEKEKLFRVILILKFWIPSLYNALHFKKKKFNKNFYLLDWKSVVISVGWKSAHVKISITVLYNQHCMVQIHRM